MKTSTKRISRAIGACAIACAFTSTALCIGKSQDGTTSQDARHFYVDANAQDNQPGRSWTQKSLDGIDERGGLWYQDTKKTPGTFTFFDTREGMHPFARFNPMTTNGVQVWTGAQDADVHGESIEIHMSNDDITVKVNGEEIPPERIRREDGRIIILDENGNELRDFNVFINNGENPFANIQMPEWRNMIEDGLIFDQFGQPFNAQADPPNAMIGIHMDEPGAALRKHLRLGEDEGVMVVGVLTGLPAHGAGIGEFDVILSIDGEDVATAEDLRGAIAEHEAGDVIELEVIQSGRRRAVEVELVGYDPEAMAGAEVIGSVPGAAQDLWFTPRGNAPFNIPDGDGGGRFLFAPDGENIMRFQFPRDLQFDPNLNAWREFRPDMIFDRDRGEWKVGVETGDAEDEEGDQLDRLDRRIAELERLLDRLIEEANRRDDG